MDNKTIANILYDMSLDMDWADYKEYFEGEIELIKKDLDILKNNDSVLFHVLEIIASDNIDNYDRFEDNIFLSMEA